MTDKFTELRDYTLWYDGVVSTDVAQVPQLLLRGLAPEQIKVMSTNPDLDLFNQLSEAQIELAGPREPTLCTDWNIPAGYLELDLRAHIAALCRDLGPLYQQRAAQELDEIERRGLLPLFKTLVYVCDRLKEQGVVWGVGRGSSCASLVLFLIGLHCVDPVMYDIDLEEFFHD